MHCAFCGAHYTARTAGTPTLNKQTRCPQCSRTRDEQIFDLQQWFEAHGGKRQSERFFADDGANDSRDTD